MMLRMERWNRFWSAIFLPVELWPPGMRAAYDVAWPVSAVLYRCYVLLANILMIISAIPLMLLVLISRATQIK